ncbi:hypothetical protein BC937DRAFT_91483 [Endogone sp. FLAS-F59071]|nr:hypothetical protein BC937DRAFT_91483 [Endogone sp. FLAS-F59071]|eukprot:RUS16224.1 hypothetical protein BC937DRAFT_91483 [Endogone sp. FLAS-F59071]
MDVVSTPEIFNFLELDDVDLSDPATDLKLLSSFDGGMLDIQPMVPPSAGLVPSKLEAEAGAFNISWSNDPDRAPAPVPVRKECTPQGKSPMLEERGETPGAAKLPLPKPRGIRKAPEPEDAEHAEKRLKNTDAARRSRLKKFLKIASLQKKVQELQSQNAQLALRVALLESEKGGWEVKETEYRRRLGLVDCGQKDKEVKTPGLALGMEPIKIGGDEDLLIGTATEMDFPIGQQFVDTLSSLLYG